jgi:hypothetical protein
MQQQVRRLTAYRHQILYPTELPTFRLVVDFGPLVEALNLTGDYCLVHWQARPRGERRWGVFSCEGEEHRYQGCWGYRSDLPCQGFQLNESGVAVVPTAVLVYRDAVVRMGQQFAEIVRPWTI